MKAEDLIFEVDDEIESEKRERAKSILKQQRKHVDDLQNRADKAAAVYEDMLELEVEELIEEYGDCKGGIVVNYAAVSSPFRDRDLTKLDDNI